MKISKFNMGFIGLLIFAIGAVMTGHGIDKLTTKESIGMLVMFAGVYMSGYFLAYKEN